LLGLRNFRQEEKGKGDVRKKKSGGRKKKIQSPKKIKKPTICNTAVPTKKKNTRGRERRERERGKGEGGDL